MLDSLFAPFERTADPRRIGVFRVLFYSGVMLHFLPSFLFFSENYSGNAIRSDHWNSWLYSVFPNCPEWALILAAVLTWGACITGLLGRWHRCSAAVAGLGLYFFASVNSSYTDALVLLDVWAIFMIWVFFGNGPAARGLIVAQIALGLGFSGVHKILAGWPMGNPMHLILSYPEGMVVRSWVARSDWLRSNGLCRFLSLFVPLVETGIPILLCFRRARTIGVVLLGSLMSGIYATIQIPFLFFLLYVSVAILVLDDSGGLPGTPHRMKRQRARRRT